MCKLTVWMLFICKSPGMYENKCDNKHSCQHLHRQAYDQSVHWIYVDIGVQIFHTCVIVSIGHLLIFKESKVMTTHTHKNKEYNLFPQHRTSEKGFHPNTTNLLNSILVRKREIQANAALHRKLFKLIAQVKIGYYYSEGICFPSSTYIEVHGALLLWDQSYQKKFCFQNMINIFCLLLFKV